VLLIRSEVNLGFGPANNLGFQAAGGRYIVLLNSDAFLERRIAPALCGPHGRYHPRGTWRRAADRARWLVAAFRAHVSHGLQRLACSFRACGSLSALRLLWARRPHLGQAQWKLPRSIGFPAPTRSFVLRCCGPLVPSIRDSSSTTKRSICAGASSRRGIRSGIGRISPWSISGASPRARSGRLNSREPERSLLCGACEVCCSTIGSIMDWLRMAGHGAGGSMVLAAVAAQTVGARSGSPRQR
jgi:hypothetical protein